MCMICRASHSCSLPSVNSTSILTCFISTRHDVLWLHSLQQLSTISRWLLNAYTAGFQIFTNNCQSTAAAAVYGSCLCQKDSDAITNDITSLCYTIAHCTNGETASAVALYSSFCSSATALVEQYGLNGGGDSSAGGGSSGGGTSSNGGSSGGRSGSSVSPGAIAGIVIGVIIGVVLVACAIFFGLRYHKRRERRKRAMEEDRRRAQNNVQGWDAFDHQPQGQRPIPAPQPVRMADLQNGSVYRPPSSLGYPMRY